MTNKCRNLRDLEDEVATTRTGRKPSSHAGFRRKLHPQTRPMVRKGPPVRVRRWALKSLQSIGFGDLGAPPCHLEWDATLRRGRHVLQRSRKWAPAAGDDPLRSGTGLGSPRWSTTAFPPRPERQFGVEVPARSPWLLKQQSTVSAPKRSLTASPSAARGLSLGAWTSNGRPGGAVPRSRTRRGATPA